MNSTRVVRLAVVVLATLFLGCAARRPNPFPSSEKLAQIAAKAPAGDGLEDRALADVETWTLTGPFPDTIQATPRSSGTAWDALVSGSLEGGRNGQMTEAMACVARELGLFWLAQKAHAVNDLREFVAARCGSSTSHVSMSFRNFEKVAAETSDDELLAASRESLAAEVKALAGAGHPFDAGIWFGRKDGSAVVLLAIATRFAELAPVSIVPGADGIVSVKGTALVPATHVGAYVTRGPFGVEACTPDANVVPPSFSLECRVEPGDAAAWIDVGVTPQGRILARGVVSLLVFPSGKPANVYQRPAIPVAYQPTPGNTLEAGFIEALNAVRQRALLTRVNDAPAQSATAKRLAPHFFSRMQGTTSDLIGLGLMAGWEVDGIVRYGRFTAAWQAHSDDPTRLLATILTHAMGRTVLLDPDAAFVALGTVASSSRKVVGALIGSYTMYDAQVHDIRVMNALPRLAKIRTAAGKAPAVRVKGLEGFAREAANAVESGKPPKKVLQEFMRKTSEKKRTAVYGLVIETESLRDFTLPADLAGAQSFEYELAVAYYKNPGEPWGRYVLLFVFVGGIPA